MTTSNTQCPKKVTRLRAVVSSRYGVKLQRQDDYTRTTRHYLNRKKPSYFSNFFLPTILPLRRPLAAVKTFSVSLWRLNVVFSISLIAGSSITLTFVFSSPVFP